MHDYINPASVVREKFQIAVYPTLQLRVLYRPSFKTCQFHSKTIFMVGSKKHIFLNVELEDKNNKGTF